MRRTIIALIGALLLCGGLGVAQELSGAGVLPDHADVGVPRVNNLTLLTGTWTCAKGDSWCSEDSDSGDAKTELADGDVILMTDGTTWYSFTVADADSSAVDADSFRRARLVEGVLQSSGETLPLIDSSALYLVEGITASTLDTVVDGAGGTWPFQVAEDEIYFPSGVTINVDAGATLVLPENNISGDELGAFADSFISCGANNENGTVYTGPATALFLGDGSTSYAIDSAACDALTNATEATADAPLVAGLSYKVTGMWCYTDATLGAGESIVYTLRSAEADTTPAITCTIGEAVTFCRSVTPSTTDIAAGATVAVKVVQSSNNADADDSWCKIGIVLK